MFQVRFPKMAADGVADPATSKQSNAAERSQPRLSADCTGVFASRVARAHPAY